MTISSMIKWLRDHSFPPIVIRSISIYRKIRSESKEEPKTNIVLYVLFILIAILFWWFSFKIDIPSDFIAVSLTALAVLSGFLINLMIYTSNAKNLDDLSYHKAEEISKDIRFLMRFQLLTFSVYIYAIVFGLAIFVVPKDVVVFSISNYLHATTEALFFLGLSLSILCSLILPFQLYEVHSSLLDMLVNRKKEEREKYIDDLKEESQKEIE